jgi:hypothetical protein
LLFTVTEIDIFSNSRNLLYISTVLLLYTVKEKGEKPGRKPYPLPYGLTNPYRNLKPENSQDYAQKLQRNCKFMNSASSLISWSNGEIKLLKLGLLRIHLETYTVVTASTKVDEPMSLNRDPDLGFFRTNSRFDNRKCENLQLKIFKSDCSSKIATPGEAPTRQKKH